MIDSERLAALFGLPGKTAVVTGAGSGIGRAIAETLATAGARVIAADRDAEAGAATARRLEQAGFQAGAIAVDIAEKPSVDALAETVDRDFGGIDIWVNNAGIFPKSAFLDVTPELWDRVQAVNLRGTFLGMQAAIRSMKAHGRGGRIVNISSVASRNATAFNQPYYNAAKAGVSALTRATAAEFAGDRILVNGILPGGVATEGAAKFSASAVPVAGPIVGPGRIPLGRVAEPWEIASAVLFLASPASGYVTGQELAVDGGFLVS